MRHDWVLDVLSDLSAYARQNRLPGLAEQLCDARHVAAAELARDSAAALPIHAVGADAEGVRDRL